MHKLDLTWPEVERRAEAVAKELITDPLFRPGPIKLFGVPNGGIPAAQAVRAALIETMYERERIDLVETPEAATVIVDDIIDSGDTRERHAKYGKPFFALVDKPKEGLLGTWVSFPHERMIREDGPQDAVRRILQYIGEDPTREGLLETPDRVVRSYAELFAGYRQDPAGVFKTFADGACDEVVLLKNIEVCSTCEHHMLPFTGRAHVAYIPEGRVIGISKLARLVDIFARRLQVQERLTTEVTTALDFHLKPKGSACIIEARHMCMSCRGVGKQHSEMVTSSLTGVFRNKPEARAELLTLVRS